MYFSNCNSFCYCFSLLGIKVTKPEWKVKTIHRVILVPSHLKTLGKEEERNYLCFKVVPRVLVSVWLTSTKVRYPRQGKVSKVSKARLRLYRAGQSIYFIHWSLRNLLTNLSQWNYHPIRSIHHSIWPYLRIKDSVSILFSFQSWSVEYIIPTTGLLQFE